MKLFVLFDQDGPRIGPNAGHESAPTIDSLAPLVEKMRTAQEALRKISFDDIIGLCDAAALAWARPENPMSEFIRTHGLGFLLLWMRRSNLITTMTRALRGHPESLDAFVRLSEADSTFVRAQPRGLAVHWIAGNVPVLGMLSLLQSLLCKNANLLKVSRTSPGMLPHLVHALSDATYTNPQGKTFSGRLLTDSIGIVYSDRNDDDAARELSRLADVRVAWGGREAVEAIIALPRRFGTEDVVFGPKLSFAIVGAERLNDSEVARRTAAAIAGDACAFDQQGCNSPHAIFVERGGTITPAQFSKLMAEAMETENRRTPLREVDPAASMNVQSVRAEYAMRGEAFHGQDIAWSVLYSDEDTGLADPCYLRTLFVRPIDDVFSVTAFCSRDSQSVGLAVDDRRHALATALTACGVERCPNVGNMRLYDTPWDGLFAMDRLVRWVSTY